ncbi:MAG TPA: ABC transporter ATP-binding protein [Nitrospiria bacterium]|nr:ABC transporter ATP-binding protein [Nitrospiria bacterium]
MPRPQTQIARLLPFIRRYLPSMALAAVLMMGVAGLNLIMLWKTRDVINSLSGHAPIPQLNAAIGIIIILLAVHSVLTMGHSYLVAAIGQRVMMDFRVHLFDHLTGLSIGFFNRRRTGELISRLTNDVQVIQRFTTEVPINLAKQVVTLIGGLGILFYINWRLCLLILAVLPLIALTGFGFGRRLKKLSTVIQDRTAETTTVLEEAISGIRVVKSFVAEGYESIRFGERVGQTTRSALSRAGVLAIFVPVITFLTFGSGAGILWYGARQVQANLITPGDLIVFLLTMGILIGPFGAFAHLFSQIKEMQGATQRVFEILDLSPEVIDQPGADPLPPIKGRVVFDRVSFQYAPDAPVLHDISFEVNPGELVALVGPSGAGKSTFMQLLHRFYDPTSGRIEIDGHDIRAVQLASLYRQIGLVPQETHLFGGTIRENILYGRQTATEEEMVAAARAANIHPFITELPSGYETVVGEKGLLLSAGQRQRISIARAILKNPRLLLLDEATSSLDNESELLIQEALERLMKGRTTFAIAHRLTTIQNAHRILVIEKGRLVEQGTHQDLLARKGLYHHLYTMRLAGVEL